MAIKGIHLAVLAVTVSVQSFAGTHADHLRALESIPLVQGYEKQNSDEKKIAQELGKIFGKIADEAKNKDGSINRGTHARGACYNGQVTLFSREELASDFKYSEALINKIKQGFFAHEGAFSAQVRFANGKGQRNPDTTNDVRAISFAIETNGIIKDPTGSSRLDFMMNSTPMFATNNIKEFYELMKAARLAQGDLSYILNPFYLKSTLKGKKLLDQYERNDAKSYATEDYWSNLPYTHGSSIVKYKVTPCDGKGRQSESSEGKSAKYLQEDMVKRVQNNQVCFHLQVQLFDHAKLKNSLGGIHKNWSVIDWMENGGELWEESVLPFHNIAKIEIPVSLNKGMGTDRACEDNYINTRLHSSASHRPIGSIARVRTYVEEKSRAKRLGETK